LASLQLGRKEDFVVIDESNEIGSIIFNMIERLRAELFPIGLYDGLPRDARKLRGTKYHDPNRVILGQSEQLVH
jgi:hypothetical protein